MTVNCRVFWGEIRKRSWWLMAGLRGTVDGTLSLAFLPEAGLRGMWPCFFWGVVSNLDTVAETVAMAKHDKSLCRCLPADNAT